MKALTVHQPFAWSIGHDQPGLPRKNYENRSKPTSYRGPILIHAGARPPVGAYDLNVEAVGIMGGPGTPRRLYEHGLYGGLLAIARIAGCELVTTAAGPTKHVKIKTNGKERAVEVDGWRILGSYAWKLEDIRPLPWVPYSPGFLGFWTVEAWRLGACRAVYEAAWSELEGRAAA
jgi:hypothetical protein